MSGYEVLSKILIFFVYAMSLMWCYRNESVDVNADIREYMAEYIGYDYCMARMVKYDQRPGLVGRTSHEHEA